MAIRAGSGGLRFPLPNQSEIQARQNAAAASAGGSAAASTYSANRQFAGQQRALRYTAVNNELNRQFQGFQAEQDRGLKYQLAQQQFANQQSLQESAQKFSAKQAKKNFAGNLQLQQQQQAFQAEQNLLKGIDEANAQQQQQQFLADQAEAKAKAERFQQHDQNTFNAQQAELDRKSRLDQMQQQQSGQYELEGLRQQGVLDRIGAAGGQDATGGLQGQAPLGQQPTGPQSGPPGQITVTTPEEYNALPVGAMYKHPDGTIRMKAPPD